MSELKKPAVTRATAAVAPQVDNQSDQPTMNPAYSPKAYRAKTYCPPERGSIVPSSAIDNAPRNAYKPPINQTIKNNQTFGSCVAMFPGARKMAAPMVLPMITERPKPTPRILSR